MDTDRLRETYEPPERMGAPLLPLFVRDVPEHYLLVTDSQDIAYVLWAIGRADRQDGAGCLFVDTADGEYLDVLLCLHYAPCANYWLERLEVRA